MRAKQLTPKYISIKINGNNQQCCKAITTAAQYGLNQQLTFLYTSSNHKVLAARHPHIHGTLLSAVCTEITS